MALLIVCVVLNSTKVLLATIWKGCIARGRGRALLLNLASQLQITSEALVVYIAPTTTTVITSFSLAILKAYS